MSPPPRAKAGIAVPARGAVPPPSPAWPGPLAPGLPPLPRPVAPLRFASGAQKECSQPWASAPGSSSQSSGPCGGRARRLLLARPGGCGPAPRVPWGGGVSAPAVSPCGGGGPGLRSAAAPDLARDPPGPLRAAGAPAPGAPGGLAPAFSVCRSRRFARRCGGGDGGDGDSAACGRRDGAPRAFRFRPQTPPTTKGRAAALPLETIPE